MFVPVLITMTRRIVAERNVSLMVVLSSTTILLPIPTAAGSPGERWAVPAAGGRREGGVERLAGRSAGRPGARRAARPAGPQEARPEARRERREGRVGEARPVSKTAVLAAIVAPAGSPATGARPKCAGDSAPVPPAPGSPPAELRMKRHACVMNMMSDTACRCAREAGKGPALPMKIAMFLLPPRFPAWKTTRCAAGISAARPATNA